MGGGGQRLVFTCRPLGWIVAGKSCKEKRKNTQDGGRLTIYCEDRTTQRDASSTTMSELACLQKDIHFGSHAVAADSSVPWQQASGSPERASKRLTPVRKAVRTEATPPPCQAANRTQTQWVGPAAHMLSQCSLQVNASNGFFMLDLGVTRDP